MRALVLSCLLAFGTVRVAIADTKETAEDFMAIHQIEIVFHDAVTTNNLQPNGGFLTNRNRCGFHRKCRSHEPIRPKEIAQ